MVQIYYRVDQKKGDLKENGFNKLQTYQKRAHMGCFGKFRIFATKWALRFSVIYFHAVIYGDPVYLHNVI